MEVLLLEAVHDDVRVRFEQMGWRVRSRVGSLSEEELIEEARGVAVLGVRSRTRIGRRVLERLGGLVAVGCFCIGTDMVDLAAADEFGVCVFNAPFASGRSVAELCLAEIICLARRVPDFIREMHGGVWRKSAEGCREIRGKTLGIVGYGNIGTQLSVLAEGLGMTVFYYDVVSKVSLGCARAAGTLEGLLRESDFVSLHVPDDLGTRGMIGPEQIQMMKPGAMLLNASRGRVVDLVALRQALDSRQLAGCAIDVYPDEPASNTSEWSSPLRGAVNTILTPHIGGSTEEAQRAIGLDVSSKIIKFLTEGATIGSVNFPSISLPSPPMFRILHVHQNVPGVLKKLMSILESTNISGQTLGTRGRLGVCLLDTNDPLTLTQEQTIRQMAETVRLVRVTH